MAKEKNTENISENEVTRRPYVIVITILIILLVLGIYIYRVRQVHHAEAIQSSYLLSTDTLSLEIKNLEEIDQILSEAPNEYFVLISYTNNEANYKLETKLKTIIDKYALSDRFYYLDVSSIINEDDYLARINNAFKTDIIKNVPIILYFKDGKIDKNGTISRVDKKSITAGDFQKMLDSYGFEGQ